MEIAANLGENPPQWCAVKKQQETAKIEVKEPLKVGGKR